jgi:hypothetical protein
MIVGRTGGSRGKGKEVVNKEGEGGRREIIEEEEEGGSGK